MGKPLLTGISLYWALTYLLTYLQFYYSGFCYYCNSRLDSLSPSMPRTGRREEGGEVEAITQAPRRKKACRPDDGYVRITVGNGQFTMVGNYATTSQRCGAQSKLTWSAHSLLWLLRGWLLEEGRRAENPSWLDPHAHTPHHINLHHHHLLFVAISSSSPTEPLSSLPAKRRPHYWTLQRHRKGGLPNQTSALPKGGWGAS